MNRLNTHYNALNSSLEPITGFFMATMDIMGHKFIIRCNGQLSPKLQDMWFSSITEVLGVGTQIKG